MICFCSKAQGSTIRGEPYLFISSISAGLRRTRPWQALSGKQDNLHGGNAIHLGGGSDYEAARNAELNPAASVSIVGDKLFRAISGRSGQTVTKWTELFTSGGDGCELRRDRLKHKLVDESWRTEILDTDSVRLCECIAQRFLCGFCNFALMEGLLGALSQLCRFA